MVVDGCSGRLLGLPSSSKGSGCGRLPCPYTVRLPSTALQLTPTHLDVAAAGGVCDNRAALVLRPAFQLRAPRRRRQQHLRVGGCARGVQQH